MEQLEEFIRSIGATNIGWQQGIMLTVGLIFVYLAIARRMEPYELLPIGLGVVVANLPLTGIVNVPTETSGYQEAGIFGIFFHFGRSSPTRRRCCSERRRR